MIKKYFSNPSDYIYNIIILISLILLCVSLFQYIASFEYLKLFYLNYLFIFFSISLILLCLRIFSKNLIITYINIILLTFGFSLIIIEIFITINMKKSAVTSNIEKRAYHAKKLGLEFDKRSKFEVYNEMLENNIKVVPSIPPNDFFVNYKLYKSKDDIYALSGISSSKTVFCNEGGKRVIYDSDRHGFRNREEFWEKNEIDYILLGDSYAQGACVDDKDTVHERIIFYTNKSLLNLGYQGHGPLMQLAALKEYGFTKKPKKIIWFYLETNDIDNLVYEYQWEVFKKYLTKPNYSQNLILKQEQIDKEHKEIINKIYFDSKTAERNIEKNKKHGINHFVYAAKKIIKLYHLRLFISYYMPRKHSLVNDYYSPLNTFDTYGKILDEAIRTANIWGGQIYFVYIPSSSRYFGGTTYAYPQRKYEYIRKMTSEKKINFIDLKKEVFEKYDYNKNIFPLNISGHPNEKGYDQMAKYISKILKQK